MKQKRWSRSCDSWLNTAEYFSVGIGLGDRKYSLFKESFNKTRGSNKGRLRWFEKNSKKLKREQVNGTTDTRDFTNIYRAQGQACARCWSVWWTWLQTALMTLTSSGAGSETKRKLNNTAFTTASQWHGHRYYLVPGWVWKPRNVSQARR